MARQRGDQHWTRRRLKAGLPAGNLNQRKKPVEVKLPEPVKYDSRICFSIVYFKTEADANVYAADVRRRGYTYNGGYFHGMSCGREASRDYVDDVLGQLYAVTR